MTPTHRMFIKRGTAIKLGDKEVGEYIPYSWQDNSAGGVQPHLQVVPAHQDRQPPLQARTSGQSRSRRASNCKLCQPKPKMYQKIKTFPLNQYISSLLCMHNVRRYELYIPMFTFLKDSDRYERVCTALSVN